MPTYAYACTTCDERIEVVQRFTDAALTDCPSCEGTLRKVFTPVGIVFKGSGFYKTDARSPNRSSSATSEKPADKAAGEPAGKPAEKKESAPAGQVTPPAATGTAAAS